MAAGLSPKFAMSSGSTIDLTSISTNPDAAPESTPRQGGFTLRNRVDFSKLTAANRKTFTFVSSASQNANVFRVLSVPARTMVRGPVRVFAVASQTIPGHKTQSATTAASLDNAGAAAIIGFTGTAYKDPSQTAASIVLNNDPYKGGSSTNKAATLGHIPIQKFDNATDGIFEASIVEAVDSSMTAPQRGMVRMGTGDGAVVTGSAVDEGGDLYFPYGGFVVMGLGPSGVATGAMASSKGNTEAASLYGALSGVWEIQAQCMYVPE
jgi:hypothetical protein